MSHRIRAFLPALALAALTALGIAVAGGATAPGPAAALAACDWSATGPR